MSIPATSLTTPEPQNPTYAYIGAFVDELARAGLRHVVICPGSRSTPLALTFASLPVIHSWMHIDERSAAFFALGMAKRLDQPVALLCTSGTAAANFLPAVAEAHLTHIPLLVLTSDRPHELRDCGAPQAIDQNRLYGTHTKWFVDTALPEATNAALRYIRTIANRALAQTQEIPSGPVHVNLPLREPLTPAPIPGQPLPPLTDRDPLAWQGRADNQPYTRVHRDQHTSTIAENTIRALAARIRTSPRGLIIVGPQTDMELTSPVLQLARQTGYPILADPLSQMRGAGNEQDALICSYDAFLRDKRFLNHHAPQTILRFGAMPTSKPVLLYLQQFATCPQIIIDPHHVWEEPTQLAEQILYCEAKNFCMELLQALSEFDFSGDQGAQADLSASRLTWTRTWTTADKVTRQAISASINDFSALFEGRIFTELATLLPTDALLYAGNSMPIRDMDTFFWPREQSVRCLGNRGANGIDGVISSALGASAASEPGEPATLVIGDLSFFHDLNGLLAARLHSLNLTIILVNNDGGGIFSFLPQAAYREHFEQLFGTPTGLDFRPIVETYGGTFQSISRWDEFRQAFKASQAACGLHVIEVPTERESNVVMHRRLWQAVEQALAQVHLLADREA